MTLQFSCSLTANLCRFQVDSKNNRISASLGKQTDMFNRGPSALPTRYIENEELLPFTDHVAVKKFLDASNLINLMFMSPHDFLLKKAKRKYDTKITDPFYCLRETVAILWKDVFETPEVNTYTYKYVEDKFNDKPYTAKFETQLKGCYLFRGMPFLRATFIDVSKALEFSGKSPARENVVRLKRSESLVYDPETGYPRLMTLFISQQEHLLARRLMLTNSLRMRQGSKSRSADDWYWETYLPMLFRREMACNSFDWKTEMAELKTDFGDQHPDVERVCISCSRTVSNHAAVECVRSCGAVSYCSHSCQTADWPRHKASCRNYTYVAGDVFKRDSKSAEAPGEACAGCGKASSNLKKCTRCLEVSYCDRTCQQADWSAHKTACRESIRPTTSIGEKSRDQSAKEVCAACGKASENLKRCGRCKEVSYCDRNCQQGHWSEHKSACRSR